MTEEEEKSYHTRITVVLMRRHGVHLVSLDCYRSASLHLNTHICACIL